MLWKILPNSISVLGAMMLWGVYFYKNRYIFIVPWLVFYGLGIFAGFILGIGAITKGAPAYSWVTLFLTSKQFSPRH